MQKNEKDLKYNEKFIEPKFLLDFSNHLIVPEKIFIGECNNCNKENVMVINFSKPSRTYKFEDTLCADCFLESLKNKDSED